MRRELRVAIVGCALCSAIACGDSPTEPAREDLIIFASDRDGDYELYTIKPDGSGLRQLTDNDVTDVQPAYSPDGKRIAFASRLGGGTTQIYVMSADGSGAVAVTADPSALHGQPSWSPDGRRLAFVKRPVSGTAPAGLFVANADGTDLRRLTDGDLDFGPAWSPGGDRIAFSTLRFELGIWLMLPDGSAATRLPVQISLGIGEPRWSPDGSRILFTGGVEQAGSSNWGVHVVAFDGTGLRTLTSSVGDRDAAWSRDGSRVVFASTGRANVSAYGSELYIMNADGSGVVRLTQSAASEQNPSWSR